MPSQTRNRSWPSLEIVRKKTKYPYTKICDLRVRIGRFIFEWNKCINDKYAERTKILTFMELFFTNEKLIKSQPSSDGWDMLINTIVSSAIKNNCDYVYLEKFRRIFDTEYKLRTKRNYIQFLMGQTILGPDIARIIASKVN